MSDNQTSPGVPQVDYGTESSGDEDEPTDVTSILKDTQSVPPSKMTTGVMTTIQRLAAQLQKSNKPDTVNGTVLSNKSGEPGVSSNFIFK